MMVKLKTLFNTNEVMSENEQMPFGPALLDSHPSFDNMSPQKIRHDYQEVPEQHLAFNPALHESKLDNGGYVQQGLDDFQQEFLLLDGGVGK